MAIRTIKTTLFRIIFDLPTLEVITDRKRIVTNQVSRELGVSVRKEVLALVAVGKSPIKGKGRFRAYAAQRKGQGYPEIPRIKRRFPGKKTRPINLRLNGKYLRAILKTIKIEGGIAFEELDEFNKKLFESHNEGKHPDVPQRKVLPTGKDTFVPIIIRAINKVYLKRIKRIIKT